jgi:hypothetical protein
MMAKRLLLQRLGQCADDDRRFDGDDLRVGRQRNLRLLRRGGFRGRRRRLRTSITTALKLISTCDGRHRAAAAGRDDPRFAAGPAATTAIAAPSPGRDEPDGRAGKVDKTDFFAHLRLRRRGRNNRLGRGRRFNGGQAGFGNRGWRGGSTAERGRRGNN